jgi:hypothetical protein
VLMLFHWKPIFLFRVRCSELWHCLFLIIRLRMLCLLLLLNSIVLMSRSYQIQVS